MKNTKDKKRSLGHLPRTDSSPYTDTLLCNPNITPLKKDLYSDKTAFVEETGQKFKAPVYIGSDFYWKDNDQYVKVFKGDHMKIMAQLGTPAIKLLFYIAENLPINRDTIYVTFADFAAFSGIKARTTYYDAVIELAEAGVISLHRSPNLFYVNPTVMFNGKREYVLPDPEIEFHKNLKVTLYKNQQNG